MAFDYTRSSVHGAAELARRALERWNAHDLEAVFADWDSTIVVRPDPYYPDAGELVGCAAARRFWQDQRDSMGFGHMEILQEHDLENRCLLRVRQEVDTRSGVRGSYEWSFLTTALAGKVVMIEFFLDRDRALAAAGVVDDERG